VKKTYAQETRERKDLANLPDVDLLINDQILTPWERQLLGTVYSRLTGWQVAIAEYHQYVKDCRLTVRRKDPYQDPTPAEGTTAGPETLQLNTLKSTRDNVVASLLENTPRAAMIPETSKKKTLAEDITDVTDYILEQCDFENEYRMYVEDYVDVGTGVLQTLWDDNMANGEGEAAIIRWPVEAMLWDPMSDNIPECRAVMKLSWHPLAWYREHFPQEGEFVQGDAHLHEGLGQEDASAEDFLTEEEDDEKAMLIEYWWRTYDPGKKRYHIHQALVAGGALLEVSKDVYAHGRYPFVFSAFTRIEGTPVGEGLIGEFVPTMRYINRWNKYLDENFRMAAKNRMLVRRNAKINLEQLKDFNQDVVEGEAIDEMAVRWFQGKPMNGLTMQAQMQLQTDMKQDSGLNQFARGETTGGVTAMGAIQTLAENGSKITRYRTKALQYSFREAIEQILWIISEMYDSSRMRLITGRSGKERDVDFNSGVLMEGAQRLEKDGVFIPPYSVRVEIERKSPSAIQETNNAIMQAYQMAVQAGQNFPLSALFDSLTIEGKERILPLLLRIEAENDKLAQAMTIIQQQQAAIDGMKKQMKGLIGSPSTAPAPAPAPEGVPPTAA
jgi:hypothetical protein